MEIKAFDDYLTLPELIEESTAELIIFSYGNPEQHPESYGSLVCRTSFHELMKLKTMLPVEVAGTPRYWATEVIDGTPCLFVWPFASRDMFAKFRYCPAMKEI